MTDVTPDDARASIQNVTRGLSAHRLPVEGQQVPAEGQELPASKGLPVKVLPGGKGPRAEQQSLKAKRGMMNTRGVKGGALQQPEVTHTAQTLTQPTDSVALSSACKGDPPATAGVALGTKSPLHIAPRTNAACADDGAAPAAAKAGPNGPAPLAPVTGVAPSSVSIPMTKLPTQYESPSKHASANAQAASLASRAAAPRANSVPRPVPNPVPSLLPGSNSTSGPVPSSVTRADPKADPRLDPKAVPKSTPKPAPRAAPKPGPQPTPLPPPMPAPKPAPSHAPTLAETYAANPTRDTVLKFHETQMNLLTASMQKTSDPVLRADLLKMLNPQLLPTPAAGSAASYSSDESDTESSSLSDSDSCSESTPGPSPAQRSQPPAHLPITPYVSASDAHMHSVAQQAPSQSPSGVRRHPHPGLILPKQAWKTARQLHSPQSPSEPHATTTLPKQAAAGLTNQAAGAMPNQATASLSKQPAAAAARQPSATWPHQAAAAGLTTRSKQKQQGSLPGDLSANMAEQALPELAAGKGVETKDERKRKGAATLSPTLLVPGM